MDTDTDRYTIAQLAAICAQGEILWIWDHRVMPNGRIAGDYLLAQLTEPNGSAWLFSKSKEGIMGSTEDYNGVSVVTVEYARGRRADGQFSIKGRFPSITACSDAMKVDG